MIGNNMMMQIKMMQQNNDLVLNYPYYSVCKIEINIEMKQPNVVDVYFHFYEVVLNSNYLF